MRLLFISIFLITCNTVNSQSIEELKLVIKQDSSTINKINNTLKLSAVFSRSNLDSALFYTEEAIKISSTLDKKLLTKSLMYKGVFLSLKGNFKDGDSILKQNFNRPLDSTTLGLNYINLANSYQLQKRSDEAITYFLKASEIFEKQKNKMRLAQVYGNIGSLNAQNKNFDKAINYLNKAVNNANQNEILKLQLQINLSSLYIDQDNYSKGLELAFLAEELAKKNKFKRGLGSIYTNLCKIYSDSDSLKNTKKAIDYGLLALKIKKEVGIIPVYGETLNNIGQAYIEEGDYNKATIYLKEALQNSTGDSKTEVLNNLKKLYTKLGDNKLALNYSNQLIKYKDSLTTSKQQEKVAEIIERYESDKKQQQIDVLNIKNELQQSKLDSQRNLFIGLGTLALLSLLLVYLWFMNQKTKQALKQTALQHKLLQTQLNPHFLFHSLNTIQSYIYQNKKEESANYLSNYSKLMRSILESSDVDFISIEDDAKAMLDYLELQKVSLQNNFTFNIKVDQTIKENMIPPMFVQPFIENAIIHGIKSKENGNVNLSYEFNNEVVSVKIKDDGDGYKQSESNNKLHKSMSSEIIKERIENLKKIHEFEIKIKTESNQTGTTITIKFPKKS